MATTLQIHPFEAAGLGLAPFRFTGMSENVLTTADGTVRAGGTCDYCSNGIRHEFHISSADGKRFKVGCDCVRKLDRSDNQLVTQVTRAMAKIDRDARAAKRSAYRLSEWERTKPEREARAAEVARLQAEQEAEQRSRASRSAWLAEVLERASGDFARGVAADLRSGNSTVAGLSDRCLAICRDIYARQTGGRSGSKAYDAACDRFDSMTGND